MIRALRKQVIRVGPEDHGRPMSLNDFDRAVGRDGYLYELNKGVIDVVNVPTPGHGRQVRALLRQVTLYEEGHPGVIEFVAGSGDAKLLIGPTQSERHADLSIYLSPEPADEDVWSRWVPEIVVEVVSDRSAKRDYEDKPPEYLALGVREYWIIDARRRQMTVLSRWRGQWRERVVKPPKKHSTHLLPGFALDLKRVLAAGAE